MCVAKAASDSGVGDVVRGQEVGRGRVLGHQHPQAGKLVWTLLLCVSLASSRLSSRPPQRKHQQATVPLPSPRARSPLHAPLSASLPYQTERARVASVAGNRVTLSAPLRYMHYGAVTMGVDQRAEVAD